jgi:tetratricopeptide (TPR) repeat protein
MPRRTHSLLLVLVISCMLSTRAVNAQSDRIEIAAGTEEDHALQAITAEQDPQKKLVMFQEFVQKFSANPSAVTYGNWQISQAYQAAGDLPKALDYGDKALVASPHNLDILVSQASLAQQAKDNSKLIAYAVKGGEACQSIGKQAKPAATSDEDFAKQVAEEKDAAKNNCEFLETSGFNVVASETDPKLRMADIEAFTAAYPDSKYQDQVSNYAMYTLGPGQLNDATRLVAFGEKTLAANPKSLPALLLLASVYVEEPKPVSIAKAISYSQRAIEAAKPDAPDADKPRKLSAGVAHSTIGYAYMKQEKTVAAIPELKAAVALLKGQDDIPYSVALYRLGYAYAKLVRNTEAREVLMEAVKIPGPVQSLAQELLNKVNLARSKGK